MYSSNLDYRLINRPIKLYWGGWETNTYKLSREGWEISVEQSVLDHTIGIAINHPKSHVQGIGYIESFVFKDILDRGMNYEIPIGLRFETLAQHVYVQTMGRSNFDFQPIDARPQVIESKIEKLDDFANFAVIREKPKHELYLREANIGQILDMALSKQEPDQKRIREEIIRGRELQQYRTGTLHTELRLVA